MLMSPKAPMWHPGAPVLMEVSPASYTLVDPTLDFSRLTNVRIDPTTVFLLDFEADGSELVEETFISELIDTAMHKALKREFILTTEGSAPELVIRPVVVDPRAWNEIELLEARERALVLTSEPEMKEELSHQRTDRYSHA